MSGMVYGWVYQFTVAVRVFVIKMNVSSNIGVTPKSSKSLEHFSPKKPMGFRQFHHCKKLP